MIDDTLAIDSIHAAMNGVEWNSALWDTIASIVIATGRPAFSSPDEDESGCIFCDNQPHDKRASHFARTK